ncbi:translation initiation factor IF-2 [Oryctolagus cuniculus]|uniref:translation initiation factor IF-2 n=1 Tax=Oryctolagus cuniculus TaxID=9986 RepID=UPI0038793A24
MQASLGAGAARRHLRTEAGARCGQRTADGCLRISLSAQHVIGPRLAESGGPAGGLAQGCGRPDSAVLSRRSAGAPGLLTPGRRRSGRRLPGRQRVALGFQVQAGAPQVHAAARPWLRPRVLSRFSLALQPPWSWGAGRAPEEVTALWPGAEEHAERQRPAAGRATAARIPQPGPGPALPPERAERPEPAVRAAPQRSCRPAPAPPAARRRPRGGAREPTRAGPGGNGRPRATANGRRRTLALAGPWGRSRCGPEGSWARPGHCVGPGPVRRGRVRGHAGPSPLPAQRRGRPVHGPRAGSLPGGARGGCAGRCRPEQVPAPAVGAGSRREAEAQVLLGPAGRRGLRVRPSCAAAVTGTPAVVLGPEHRARLPGRLHHPRRGSVPWRGPGQPRPTLGSISAGAGPPSAPSASLMEPAAPAGRGRIWGCGYLERTDDSMWIRRGYAGLGGCVWKADIVYVQVSGGTVRAAQLGHRDPASRALPCLPAAGPQGRPRCPSAQESRCTLGFQSQESKYCPRTGSFSLVRKIRKVLSLYCTLEWNFQGAKKQESAILLGSAVHTCLQ